MAHQIVGISTCMLCGAKFTGELGILVTGQPTNGRDAQLENDIRKLTKHLVQEHPNEYHAMNNYVANYGGFLLLSHFSSTDPRIKEQHNKMRWQIHRQTSDGSIPDDRIEFKTAELAEQLAAQIHSSEPEDAEERERTKAILINGFEPILKGFRDQLQEPGKYPAIIAENAPQSTPQ